MSRILKHKRIAAVFIIIILLELLLLLFTKSLIVISVICLSDLILSVLFIVDYKVHKYMQSQMSIFMAKSKVRNVDCLVIGELCNPIELFADKSKSYIQIKDPDISELAAFQILKRTHSILSESGAVYIILKECNLRKRTISIIDTYFYHDITIKQLGLQKKYKLRKLLLFIHPIRTISIMRGKSSKLLSEFKGSSMIKEFCTQRNMECHILIA